MKESGALALLIGLPRVILATQKINLAQQKSDNTEQKLDAVASQAQLEVQKLYEQGFEKGKRRLFREAIIDFDQAIRRDPNFVEAYIARGYAQVLIDEKESAVKDFRMAEKIYSKRKEISLSTQYRELRENLQKEIRK